jgi:fido (protein-threonine AMPylation protein)
MIDRQIWKPLTYMPEAWEGNDLSCVDDLLPSWLDHKEALTRFSPTYRAYLDRLKRRHALEGGILDRLYEVEGDVAEALVHNGFDAALISPNEAALATTTLLHHLQDQLQALDLVYQIATTEQPLSKAAIRELHAVLTVHQPHATAADGVKRLVHTPLLRGEFRRYKTLAARLEGSKSLQCPPERIDDEMDALLTTYESLHARDVHPVIVAAWFHCAFSRIQPFQDGNGRMARLLASYILLKAGLFPLTVTQAEAKAGYLPALAAAEAGSPGQFIAWIGRQQRRILEEVLSQRAFDHDTPLPTIAAALREKLAAKRENRAHAVHADLQFRRAQVFDLVATALQAHVPDVQAALAGEAHLTVGSSSQPGDPTGQHLFYSQAAAYAQLHRYPLNASHPQAHQQVQVQVGKRDYRIVLLFHHHGHGEGTWAVGGGVVLPFGMALAQSLPETARPFAPLACPPFLVALNEASPLPAEHLHAHVEKLLAAALAEIANVS